MKLKIAVILLLWSYKGLGNVVFPDEDPNVIMATMFLEIEVVKQGYFLGKENLYSELHSINSTLKNAATIEEKINLLIQKDVLTTQLAFLVNSEYRDISKVRYIKGLQIVKVLYEKILSLDHHFSATSTLRDVNSISNPNSYPEFVKMKEGLEKKFDKRSGFDLSALLGNNIYTSVVYSFVSLFLNTNTTKLEKDNSLRGVECILDFTLRMHNDLNTIYFETAFLQKKNENISGAIKELFRDYTKPLKYKTNLEDCRQTDDWEIVLQKLDDYVVSMERTMSESGKNDKIRNLQINLEFPIDRLLQFITEYNSFINEGVNFYEKFNIMLSSYENEQECSSKVPLEYLRLKEGIVISIKKFNTAYKPVEINGSQMKQLLYGISEFD